MAAIPSFSFRTVANIVSKPGAAAHLGDLIREHFPLVRRPLLVTDPGCMQFGVADGALRSLRDSGYTTSVYTKVEPDPREQIVLDAVAFAREAGSDLVIGFGGGSSMDVAKLVAALADSGQAIETAYGIGQLMGARLPLVQVPTTAGTGSEVTNIAIVTTGATTKSGIVAPQLYADMAVLDADLTLGLGARATAATGIDAMVHAIEAYTSRHKKNPMSDQLARQALQLLSRNIVTACKEPGNRAAREAMLLGACMAGQAFSNAPVAAVHALAYPVGGIFHVAHGLSNALVLPHVLRFNQPAAVDLYAELAEIVGPGRTGSAEARSAGLIAAMQQIAAETGIETRLRQVGITESDLDRLADEAMLQTRLLGNNPRELTRADALAVYAAAL